MGFAEIPWISYGNGFFRFVVTVIIDAILLSLHRILIIATHTDNSCYICVSDFDLCSISVYLISFCTLEN